MTTRNRTTALLLFTSIALLLTNTSCKEGTSSSGGGNPVKLIANGATFPAPLYSQWFKDYHDKHADAIIEYQPIGSGGGVKAFIAGTTDFGASDRAMKDDEIAKVKGGVVLLPMTAGAIVLSFNVEGVTELKLPRDVYAGIFLGKIKKWNDPAIVAANPGAKLPDAAINVVHRSDGSGTTAVFTKHLCAISPEWKAGPGEGEAVNWPVGIGGKGNDGVTANIKQNPGSIGYIEYGYAYLQKLPMAELENKSKQFVKATPESSATALASVVFPPDLRGWVPDPDGAGAYPIVTYTWLLCHTQYDDAAKGKALKDVINYGLTEGQKNSKDLGYIPLPDAVVQKVKAAADTIKVGA